MLEFNKSIVFKSVANEEVEDIGSLLAPYVGIRDDYSEFKIYKAILYTTKRDRDGERITPEALAQMADLVVGLTVIKNHAWSDVEDTVGRIVSAYIDNFEDGEKALFIRFYACEPDDIRKIDNGLYFGLSCGFCATDRTDENGLRDFIEVTDVYEVSLVTVPAVQDAHIIKQKKEVADMEDTKKELDELKAENDRLRAENEQLKGECETLKSQLCEAEEKEFETEADEALDDAAEKAADELEPNSPEVKSYIKSELKAGGFIKAEAKDAGAIKLKSGKYCVLKDFETNKATVKNKYFTLGLIGKKNTSNSELKFSSSNEQRKSFDTTRVASATVKFS